jgi:hypothetical protein
MGIFRGYMVWLRDGTLDSTLDRLSHLYIFPCLRRFIKGVVVYQISGIMF